MSLIPPAPLPVNARWIKRPIEGIGLAEINGTPYRVEELFEDDGERAITVGFRLTNLANLKVYDVGTYAGYWQCDCPQQVFRGERAGTLCKHAGGMSQLVYADVLAGAPAEAPFQGDETIPF